MRSPGSSSKSDPELLRSAFENVIRNAVHYSPLGAPVSVSARLDAPAARQEHRVEVEVSDHGPGVREKDLQLIFEPFYRVESAREHRHGRIEARNVPGGGLAVIITLPAAPRLQVQQPDAANAAA